MIPKDIAEQNIKKAQLRHFEQMNESYTVDDFIEEHIHNLHMFAEQYHSYHKAFPNLYPPVMRYGDSDKFYKLFNDFVMDVAWDEPNQC